MAVVEMSFAKISGDKISEIYDKVGFLKLFLTYAVRI